MEKTTLICPHCDGDVADPGERGLLTCAFCDSRLYYGRQQGRPFLKYIVEDLAGESNFQMLITMEQTQEKILGGLQAEEIELKGEYDSDVQRGTGTARILSANVVIIAVSTILLLRDFNNAAAAILPIAGLAILGLVTLVIWIQLNGGAKASLYKLHMIQRDVRDAANEIGRIRREIDISVNGPES